MMPAYIVESFTEAELLVDITEHELGKSIAEGLVFDIMNEVAGP